MAKELPHVVILGSGFGGLNAALGLRNTPCRVTVIDKSNHHLFQPLLYQVATAGLSPGDIAAPVRHVLRRANNTEVLMAEVTGVNTHTKHVHLKESSPIPYDHLIVATGAHHSYFGHDEWEPFAPGLKSIPDATEIRRRILSAYEEAELETDPAKRVALLTIVIVGAGPTGVEMAGSIAELARHSLKHEFQHFNPSDTRIILAEAGPRILSGFPETLSQAAQGKLQSFGVEIQVNTRVENITERSVKTNTELISAHTVIWAAGVQASPAAQWLGVAPDPKGRVPVNAFLHIEGDADIYVIGDTAHTTDEHGKELPGLAPVAMQEGRYVAKRLLFELRGKPYQKKFRYLDKGMLATIGRTYAVASIGGFRVKGTIAWLIWVFVHIMYLIGFRNRFIVMSDWIWAYLTYQRAVRLIVEKPRR